MGDFGDGRLELDELGTVIDRASSLDAPPAAELLEGNDAVTWGERLENAGVTPWLRRHRGALAAGTAAVLLIGVAGTAWVRTRPPEQLSAVDVTVYDWVPASGQSGIVDTGNGVLQSSYRVTPGSSGDKVRILGLLGPGIRASKVLPRPSPSAEPATAVADVSVVLGCDDPALATPSAQDFRLRVEETDAYGRTTSGLAELPLTTSSQWIDYITTPCMQQQISELVVPTRVTISGSLPTRTLTTAVTVHNGLGHDLTLSAAQGQQSSVYVAGGILPLPAGADVVVPVTMRVTDCANPRLDDAYDPQAGQSRPSSTHGVDLNVTRNDVANGFGATVLAGFSADQQRQVSSLLAQMCRGVPAATARVVIAGSSPIDPATEFTPTGDPSEIALRMTVDVATTAQRVVLSDGTAPEDVANGATVTVSTAGSPVKQGHARLVVDMAMSCNGVTTPPTVALQLSSGSRSWPVRASLADPHLLAAYRVACPALPADDFTSNGWPSA
jgi:hypothetical protein